MPYIIDERIWTSSSISYREWNTLEDIIKIEHVNTVLEFGSGVTTWAFNELGLNVTSFEDQIYWKDKIKKDLSIDVVLWNKKEIKLKKRFDLCFIDGPHNAEQREVCFQMAIKYSNLIACHDTHIPLVYNYQKEYLSDYVLLNKMRVLNIWKKQSDHTNGMDPIFGILEGTDFKMHGNPKKDAEKWLRWRKKGHR